MPDNTLGRQGVRLYGTEPARSIIDAQFAALNSLADQFSIRLLILYLVRVEKLNYWLAFIR